MEKLLRKIIGKKFYLRNHYTRTSEHLNFLELINVLFTYSNFKRRTTKEKIQYLSYSIRVKEFYIDCDRFVTFK